MTSWQEREQRVSQQAVNKTGEMQKTKQLGYDEILQYLSVRKMLEEIRSEVWKEGIVREVFVKDKDNDSYRTGFELVTNVPSILVMVRPVLGTLHASSGTSDGVTWGGYSYVGKVDDEYVPAVGEVEAKLSISVVENPPTWRTCYEKGREGYEHLVKDSFLAVTDTPFVKSDKLIEYKPKDFVLDDNSKLWFPLFDGRMHSSSLRLYDDSMFSGNERNIRVGSNELDAAFEKVLVEQVSRRKNTNNLPSQIREKTNKRIANLPYEKKAKKIDIRNYFYEWINKTSGSDNFINERNYFGGFASTLFSNFLNEVGKVA